MDKTTLEGIVLELDLMLDEVEIVRVEFDRMEAAVPEWMVQNLRDRLKFLLDNDPDA